VTMRAPSYPVHPVLREGTLSFSYR